MASGARSDSSSSDSKDLPASELTRLPPGLPREVVRRTQRERLIAGAALAVKERGFAGARVSDIARHAAVSLSTFYRYFTDKEEFFEAVYGTPLASLKEKEGEERFGSPTAGEQAGTPASGDSSESPPLELSPLPPGRHGLPREFVRRNQRERLIAGAAQAVAERGFAGATVSDIIRYASVSRRVFYENFAGKEECFEALREWFAGGGGQDTVITRPSPWELARRNQRKRLVEGVVKAVAERGFAGTTVSDITRHAAVAQGTFYRYFTSKEECFEAAYGTSLASLKEKEAKERFGSPLTSKGAGTPASGDSSELSPLPPGRHGLPREFVRRNQRERLIAGAAKAVVERGFAGVRVSDIARHAAVSRKTFYEQFAGKEECFEALHEWSAGGGSQDTATTRPPPDASADLSEPAHGLEELIGHYQRKRLMEGAAQAVAERGFAGATVSDIIRHAAVSRKTFYEHFANKEECFEAAYGTSLASLKEKEAKERFGSPLTSKGAGTPADSSESPPSELTRLPPGRHGLPREFVQRNQRERLIAGAAQTVAERGFAGATVSDIIRHAAVSRKTFYEHFANKEECFEAAQGISFVSKSEDAVRGA